MNNASSPLEPGLQPGNLKNEFVRLRPLEKSDFERVFQVASDPLVWEQHPTKNRYEKEVFEAYFKEAIESGSAFIVLNARTGEPIGCTRFYEYDHVKKTIAIGYTFLARAYWGNLYNRALKSLMLDYAFDFVNTVFFHIGTGNIRSQKAIEKLGAVKMEEIEIRNNNDHFVYVIHKEEWIKTRQNKKIDLL